MELHVFFFLVPVASPSLALGEEIPRGTPLKGQAREVTTVTSLADQFCIVNSILQLR
jgi:hypothetical protein